MSANAQDSTFQFRSLTPETALTAVRAALESCRKQGVQVSVAVTAVSFRTSTSVLALETQAACPMSGIRSLPRFLAVGGG